MNPFETEVRKSAVALGLHYEKMPVPAKLGFRNTAPVLVKLRDNPYDGFLVHKGQHLPLEMKSQVQYGTFPLSNIQPHQIVGLRKMVELGCMTYLLINMRRSLKDGVEVSNNRAWAFNFSQWEKLLSVLGKRKSIPVELLEDRTLFFEIPRTHVLTFDGKQLVWDLRLLLDRSTDDKDSTRILTEPWYRRLFITPAKSRRVLLGNDSTPTEEAG
jgi:penicillin-binding protein-related factor A (putative recombinase)